ncbi:hypothetical protein QQF64_032891 [Cirrhinus molitorella]|uniref:Uncharacterized protein n=1 Tax=Cirrhinus molitorella TaxID=172907 RepID=A0ABR3MSB3_9TELE
MHALLGLPYLISRTHGVTRAESAGRWVSRRKALGPRGFLVNCSCAAVHPLPSPSSVRLPDHSHQLLHRRKGFSYFKAGNFHPPSNQDPM